MKINATIHLFCGCLVCLLPLLPVLFRSVEKLISDFGLRTSFEFRGFGLRIYGLIGLLLILARPLPILAGIDTNTVAPVTARDFYNAGTRLLAATNYVDAEKMFQAALATQDEAVQPAALYNVGQTRFAAGLQRLKQGPDAQKIALQGQTALAAGEQALHRAESALADHGLDKMIAAYLEGRGARHDLREAEKAVAAAMETYGKTLEQWQRADEDFKGVAEIDPANPDAPHNAEFVERNLAKLVDRLRKMQEMMAMMGRQKQDLGKLLSKLKGQIPAPNAPPGSSGDDDDDDPGLKPESLAGKKENAGREGQQLPASLSPDQANQILNGLSLDGTRRLEMSAKEGKPEQGRNHGNW